jgi:2-polyprenyl-6-methoxyphenol hydroxylase-like FAD-dependent oxidoreductase
MTKLNRVLIVGGGIGGMSAAIALSKLDAKIDLIDLDPNWRVYGAGITITGPTLRAFHQLGILEAIKAEAYTGEGIQICNAAGERLNRLPTSLAHNEGVPSSGGIMRPVLHRILAGFVKSQGVTVRLGVTVFSIAEIESGANVVFSDRSQERYDLVVGADGLFSTVRKLTLPDSPKPEYTGQNVWRVVLPRPPEIDCRHFFLGGPWKVGLNPVSASEMYMFLLEVGPRREPLSDAILTSTLRELLGPYGGVLGSVRDQLKQGTPVVLRPLEAFILPPPWHTKRTLLIGDAAHPTTPQLASGAGMAVEDALVLAQEVAAKKGHVAQVLDSYMARRFPRCQLVVQNSLAIGKLEQARAPIQSQTKLVEDSLRALAAPI